MNRRFGLLNSPVPTFLVGMGFVVAAWSPVEASGRPGAGVADPVLTVESGMVPEGVLAATGWMLPAMAETRAPSRRTGEGSSTGFDGEAPHGPSGRAASHVPLRGAGSLHSAVLVGAAHFASDALARAGRLSAPSTAPPPVSV